MILAIVNLLLLAVAVFAVAKLLPGIRLKGFGTAILVALVYSVIHFLLFKILLFLSFPFVVLSFGLFVFVINAALLWVTDQLIEDFEMDGFGTALIASLLITLVSMFLRWVF